MPDMSKIIKIDVINTSGRKIMSATASQISCPVIYEDDFPTTNTLMIKGAGFPELPRNSSVYVIAFNKSGDRLKYTGLVNMSTENQINIRVREYASVMEERRRYYKIESNLKCTINSYIREDVLTRLDNTIVGNIRNFNIGGIFLTVDEVQLKPKDVILFSVLMENEVLDVYAEVLRIQRREDGNIEGYGCKFINSGAKQEEIFAKYVYTKQLEERMKKQSEK